jgi:hypothetical protein
MSKTSQHVVPSSDGRWRVRKSGSSKASRVFDNQGDALAYARELARKEGGDLYVHHRDGTIRERDSYGNDSFPPRDRKPSKDRSG